MPLRHMDGYDDRRNVNDGLATGGGYDQTYSPENYDGWGLYSYVYDQKDDGIYDGIRQETRYGGWAFCCDDVGQKYEQWSLEQHIVPVSGDNRFYMGFAHHGIASPFRIGWEKSGISGSASLGWIEPNNNGEIVLKKKVGDFDWDFEVWSLPSQMKGWTPGYLEIYMGIGIGAGSDFIKITNNGEVIIDQTGLTISSYGVPDKFTVPTYAGNFDDFFFYSDTGAISSVGEVRIHALAPNGAGTNSNFTPSAGSNYQCVDEALQDFDDSYNSSDGTSGHRDDFEIENLSGVTNSSSTVKALSVRALVTCSASEQVRLYVDISGTRYYSTNFSPPTYYNYIEYIWELNPSTSSPWTVAQIDVVKVGYEVV